MLESEERAIFGVEPKAVVAAGRVRVLELAELMVVVEAALEVVVKVGVSVWAWRRSILDSGFWILDWNFRQRLELWRIVGRWV